MKKIFTILTISLLLAGFYSCKKDVVAPIVTITSPTISGSEINSESIIITIEFSEIVLDFTEEDITCENGTISDFLGDGISYTAKVAAINVGAVKVSINAGVCFDEAENLNEASEIYGFSYAILIGDIIKPSVEISAKYGSDTTLNSDDLIAAENILFTFTFSEAIEGFTVSDIATTNATLSDFTKNATNYSVLLTPNTDGVVSLEIAANQYSDIAGNKNDASTSFSFAWDQTGPSSVLTSDTPEGSFISENSFTINIELNETAQLFELVDLTVSNGIPSALSGSDKNYSALITARDPGAITVQIAEGDIEDSLGNKGTASNLYTVNFSNNIPTPSFSQTEFTGDDTNIEDISFTITFSEPVTGFEKSDITATNATLSPVTGDNAVYRVTVSPDSNDVVTLQIFENTCIDADNLDNLASAVFSFTFDNVKPTVLIDSPLSPTNNSPITYSVTFSEAVTPPLAADFTCINGTIESISGLTDTYWVSVTPDSTQEDVTLTLAADKAEDKAGNFNTASNTKTVAFDKIAPVPTISNTASIANGGSTATQINSFTINFSEPVSGFEAGDITKNNATLSDFSGTDATYTVTVTATGEGEVSLGINSNVADDNATNSNSAAVPFTYNYDITQPEATISSASVATSEASNLASIVFDIQFDEVVTGFSIEGLNATLNSLPVSVDTLSPLSGSGDTYHVTLTPASDGPITLQVKETKCWDLAGLANKASAVFSFTSDRTGSTVAITSTDLNDGESTTSNSFTIDITFQEIPTGFNLADIDVTNGAASNLTNSGLIYSATITAATQGTVSVVIPAAAVLDAVGNDSLASIPFEINFSTEIPTPAIIETVADGSYSNLSIIPIKIQFTENVSGFTRDDIVLTNATFIEDELTGSTDIYTVSIEPIIDGDVTISINAAVCIDSDGLDNLALPVYTIHVERVKPIATLSSAITSTNSSPLTFTLNFSEEITTPEAGDFNIINGTIDSISENLGTYTILVDSTTTDGDISLSLNADATTDQAGNFNNASNTVVVAFDNVQPTPTLSNDSSITNLATSAAEDIVFTISFDEIVSDFELGDISFSNASLSSFSGTNDSYQVTLTPTADGEVTLHILDSVCVDGMSNSNVASSIFTFTSDQTGPTVTLSSSVAESSYTTSDSFTINIAFNDTPVGFSLTDIDVSNGSASNLTESGQNYSALITASAEGPVIVSIAEGAATDGLENGSTASNTYTVNYTTSVPEPTISTSVVNNGDTNLSSIPFTISFTENVTGFTVDDIEVTNATLTSFDGIDDNYTVSVLPAAQGVLTVNVAAAVCKGSIKDLDNTATPTYTLNYDSIIPTVAIVSTTTLTNSTPVTFSLSFSESVNNPLAGDFTVINGTINTISGSADTYSVTVDSSTTDGAISLTLDADTTEDPAGNLNTVSNTKTVNFDSIVPTVTITSAIADNSYSDVSAHLFTFTFSETVTGFTSGDISITNGTASGFTGTDKVYTATITAGSEAEVVVSVNSSVAQDTATNDNTASADYHFNYDNTNPVATITSIVADNSYTTLTSIPFTISFTETVNGFGVGGLSVTNATLTGFTGSGDSYSVNVNPTVDGDVSLTVNSSAAKDLAENTNAATLAYLVKFDGSDPATPTATISSGDVTAGNISAFAFSISGGDANIDYSYSITSNGGGAPVNGSGTLDGSGTASLSNIDVSSLLDGGVTLTVIVEEVSGRSAEDTDTVNKDSQVPTKRYNYPLTNEINVPIFSNVSITFSEIVNASSSGGTISLRRYDGDSIVETFEASDVRVSGSGTTTISFDFMALLNYETKYYITIDGSSFKDVGNNAFSGISSKDTLCFTTVANNGTRVIENSEFEVSTVYPAPSDYTNVESQNGTIPQLAGWYTTHSPYDGLTAPIEYWADGMDGVNAYDNKGYFVELNANEPSRLYQYVLLVNGANISYQFYHGNRLGGDETIELSIYDKEANNTSDAIEVIRTSTNSTAKEWKKVTGNWVSTLDTGLYQFSFETTDTGSSGNFLDGITIGLKPLVEFSTTSMEVAEGSTQNPYLSINGSVTNPSTVTVEIGVTSSATNPEDYLPGSLTINIPPGAYSLANPIEIPLNIVNDYIYESDETIILSIPEIGGVTGDLDQADSNGNGTNANTMTYTIKNDD